MSAFESCNSAYRLRYWNFIFMNIDISHIMTCCNSAYRLRYWNYIWSSQLSIPFLKMLQQCLPLAVLKHGSDTSVFNSVGLTTVATVLTACGIETLSIYIFYYLSDTWLQQCLPLAVLKQPKINPYNQQHNSCNSAYRLWYWNTILLQFFLLQLRLVATVLTACGIETGLLIRCPITISSLLQQYLPLAVLKLLTLQLY